MARNTNFKLGNPGLLGAAVRRSTSTVPVDASSHLLDLQPQATAHDAARLEAEQAVTHARLQALKDTIEAADLESARRNSLQPDGRAERAQLLAAHTSGPRSPVVSNKRRRSSTTSLSSLSSSSSQSNSKALGDASANVLGGQVTSAAERSARTPRSNRRDHKRIKIQERLQDLAATLDAAALELARRATLEGVVLATQLQQVASATAASLSGAAQHSLQMQALQQHNPLLSAVGQQSVPPRPDLEPASESSLLPSPAPLAALAGLQQQQQPPQPQPLGANEEASGTVRCRWAGCSKSYDSDERLCHHLLVKHLPKKKPKGVKCLWTDCTYTGKKTITQFDWHIRMHTNYRPYTCHGCDKAYVRPDSLNEHLKIKRDDPAHQQTAQHQAGPVPYSRTALAPHEETESEEDGPEAPTVEPRCHWQGCNVVSASHEELYSHLKEIHACGEALSRQCGWEACPYSYKGKRDVGTALSNHAIIHTEHKPFICATCGKGHRRSSHLKEHEQVHQADRPKKQRSKKQRAKTFLTSAVEQGSNGEATEAEDALDEAQRLRTAFASAVAPTFDLEVAPPDETTDDQAKSRAFVLRHHTLLLNVARQLEGLGPASQPHSLLYQERAAASRAFEVLKPTPMEHNHAVKALQHVARRLHACAAITLAYFEGKEELQLKRNEAQVAGEQVSEHEALERLQEQHNAAAKTACQALHANLASYVDSIRCHLIIPPVDDDSDAASDVEAPNNSSSIIPAQRKGRARSNAPKAKRGAKSGARGASRAPEDLEEESEEASEEDLEEWETGASGGEEVVPVSPAPKRARLGRVAQAARPLQVSNDNDEDDDDDDDDDDEGIGTDERMDTGGDSSDYAPPPRKSEKLSSRRRGRVMDSDDE